MVEYIYCPPETQNIVNQLYSNTKYSLLIMYGLWGCRRRTSILCRENKEQEPEGKKQGERELWTLFFFSKIFIEVWLTFSVALSSTAQQCDSVIHMQKYIHIFFFLILFHAVYDWIFNIFPYALQ